MEEFCPDMTNMKVRFFPFLPVIGISYKRSTLDCPSCGVGALPTILTIFLDLAD